MKSPNSKRNLARHNDSLPFEDLINGIDILLSSKGFSHLILPAEEAKIVIDLAKQKRLYVRHIVYIYPGKNKPYNRLIISLSKEKQETGEQHFYIRDTTGEYTNAYKEAMHPFFVAVLTKRSPYTQASVI